MKLIEVPFGDDPVRRCASLLLEGGFDPHASLVVVPTQRFKSYLASALLDCSGGEDLFAPSLCTAEELSGALVSSLGSPLASPSERLSLFHTACLGTPGVEEMLPPGFLSKFSRFKEAAWGTLRAFDELNREEVAIEAVERAGRNRGYRGLEAQAAIFRRLYETYAEVQRGAGSYDRTFLLRRVGDAEVDGVLGGYEAILLVAPVALTRFERRVWSRAAEGLTAIYQDTEGYDFSGVLAFREGRAEPAGSGRGERDRGSEVVLTRVPSRVSQLMAVLSVVEREVVKGTPLERIAVVNADRDFCETLHETLLALGIEANISGGTSLSKSPLYRFLSLAGSVFRSGFDAERFLELVRNPVFARFALLPDPMREYRETLSFVRRRRIFRIPPRDHGAAPGGGARPSPPFARIVEGEAFRRLGEAFRAKDFTSLAATLESLFNDIGTLPPARGRATGPGMEAAAEAILEAAVELEDLTANFEERPFDILLEHLGGRSCPVPGSPLGGVQIIGLLESRGLSFDAVIVPSFNETFFPSPPDRDVFLSPELRRVLALPTVVDRDDLEFYYLKRLVDSSKYACLLSIDDPSGKDGVPSRFRYLIGGSFREAGEIGYVLPFAPGGVAAPGSIPPPEGDGRPAIPAPVLSRPVREFSRADVDTLKTCETKYYIAKVLGIKPEEVIVRGIEGDVAGRKVHALFKDLYEAFDPETSPLNAGFYGERLARLFDAHFREGLFHTREEALYLRLLKDSLLEVVERDLERFRAGHRVCLDLMEREIAAPIGAPPEELILSGRIDRVDRTPGGGYAILDYKTGRIPEHRDHFEEKGFREAQLGIYGLLFRSGFPGRRIERLGYVDVAGERDVVVIVEGEEVEGYLDSLEAHLLDFLGGINRKGSLSLAEDPESCTFCPYGGICRVNET